MAANTVGVGDIGAETCWSAALEGVTEVVHLAARVHVMNEHSADPLSEFRRDNVAGTERLAREAARAGVSRFIFLSSIKVNGEATHAGRPFTASDTRATEDPYGLSKHEAEQVLRRVATETGMEVVVIRPPLVHGPGVKANFAAMMRWLAHGIPLPLAGVDANRRSLVALDNLVDLIAACLTHPSAGNGTFLVSDDEDLSTAELLRRVGKALGRPARLFWIPPVLFRWAAWCAGREGVYRRLCGTLQVDIQHTKDVLGWTPPVSVDEGLRRTATGARR